MVNLKNGSPIKKVHQIGTSVVVTIDDSHVQRLHIDEDTFFEEKPVEMAFCLKCES